MGAETGAWDGRTIAQRYRIECRVGEGAFGVVYRAHHLWLDVPVALKALRVEPEWSADYQQQMLSRFLVEAQLLAQLRHENIVAVLDTGVEPAQGDAPSIPWLVTEWCEGSSLAHVLEKRTGAWSLSQTWALLEPVVKALAHAHLRGIAHRDVKPGNIMVVTEADHTVPRVVDFGIAKSFEVSTQAHSALTDSDQRAFTLAYAAPEQLAHERTGPWTDVHALGLLFCELLNGRRAYEGATRQELHAAVFSPERPKVSDPENEQLAAVLGRALSLDAMARPQDAGELLAELRDALSRDIRDVELAGGRLVDNSSTERAERFAEVTDRDSLESSTQLGAPPDDPLTTGTAGVFQPGSVPATTPQRGNAGRWLFVVLSLALLIGTAVFWQFKLVPLQSAAQESASGSVPSNEGGVVSGVSASANQGSAPTASVVPSAPASAPVNTSHPEDCFDERLVKTRATKLGWHVAGEHKQFMWGTQTNTTTLARRSNGKPHSGIVIFYQHPDKASQALTLSYMKTPQYKLELRGNCALVVTVSPDDGEAQKLLDAITK